ncbi:MAG TPA: hypothetical protein VGM13_14670 [Thermoanaerobaculia bacterium]
MATGLLSLALSGCASAPHECAPDLSRNGFVQELVYPQGTPRTLRFDDYTPGSYHVRKADLLDGIRERRSTTNPEIQGVIIAGPHGPLWEYNVVLFTRVGAEIGVHWVSMPHARITWKAAGRISTASFEELAARLSARPDIRSEAPVPAPGAPGKDVEFSYGLLAAFWSPSERVLCSTWSWYEAGGGQQVVGAALQELQDPLQTTYSAELPNDEKSYVCPP